jgi:predicted ATP-grasp superfamily ATP-dependent carboligase
LGEEHSRWRQRESTGESSSVEQVITMVGASVRAAASSAVRAGYSVRAADLFADDDLRAVAQTVSVDNYPAGLETVIAGSQPGGWLYTGALENHPDWIDRWARLRPLLGNSADVLRRVRQPPLVAEVFKRFQIPCPAIAVRLGRPPQTGNWVRKPIRSAGGQHITRLGDEFAEADAGPNSSEFYFQQFIEGKPCSAAYLAAGGRSVLLGATRQIIGAEWTGASGFQYCGSIGPLALLPDAQLVFARLGEVLAREFCLVGLFGVDAVINADGVWPLEINPRYTASIELVERALDFAAIRQHVTACTTGGLPDVVERSSDRLYGKAILYAPRRLVMDRALLDAISPRRVSAWPDIADIPVIGGRIEKGWPICTLFADAEDERELVARLKQRCAAAFAAIG